MQHVSHYKISKKWSVQITFGGVYGYGDTLKDAIASAKDRATKHISQVQTALSTLSNITQ